MPNALIWRYIVIIFIATVLYRVDFLTIILFCLLFVFGFVLTLLGWSLFVWTFDNKLRVATKVNWNTGLPGTIEHMKNMDLTMPSYNHTGYEPLDNAIEHLLILILRDFVLDWHSEYLSEKVFPRVAFDSLNVLIYRLCDRIKFVNWTHLFSIKINAVASLHVKLFKESLRKIEYKESRSYNISKIITEFFNIETKIPNLISHKAICTDSEIETKYLTFFVESLLFLLLPEENFDDKVLRYLLRDIILNKVVLPFISMICDPDYINQFIHKYKSESFYTSDSFINAIRINSSNDDLIELLKAINLEITKLSGNDMDEKEFEEITKRQISSLTFVKRLCIAQIESMRQEKKISQKNEPQGVDFPTTNINNSFSDGGGLNNLKIPEIPIKNLIEDSYGFPFLLDYFQEIGDVQLLFLYIDIKSVFDSFSSFLTSEEYLKKAVFFNDRRIMALRDTVIHLIRDYQQQIESNSIRLITRQTLDEIHKEISATIPSVDSLRNLQRQILNYLQEPSYVKKFYDSPKYYKMCVEMKIIKPSPVPKIEIDLFTVMNDLFLKSFSIDLMITETLLCGPPHQQFSVYVIQIMVIAKDFEKSWVIHRRFRHFVEFHEILLNKFPVISYINFPEKKVFGNKTPDNVEKRKHMLNKFMKALLDNELFKKNRVYFELIITFLDKKKWAAIQDQSVDVLSKNVNYISNADDNNLEANEIFKNELELALSKNFITNLDSDEIESLALSIIVNLVEDLFDVKNKTPWLTRQIKTVFKELFIAVVGDRIGRKIVDHTGYLFNLDQVVLYLTAFRESFWPGNVWSGPGQVRTPEMKSRERLIASSILIGMMPNELRRFLGEDVTLDGINKLFHLLQVKQLNKRLFYTVLETIIESLFPDNSFMEIFKNLNEHYCHNLR